MSTHREPANQSPRLAKQGAQQATAPRSAWDAVVETVTLFGSAAPPILLIALLAFGAYKFLELSAKIDSDRANTDKLYKESIVQGADALVKIYKSNLELQLDLQKKQQDFQNKQQELQEAERRLEANEQKRKESERNVEKLNSQVDQLARDYDIAITMLGAIGALVEDAPELLRAAATKQAVRDVLAKSDRLFLDERDRALSYNHLNHQVHILLALADLDGFLGDAANEEKLAEKALAAIRESPDRLRNGDSPLPGIEAEEAMAHLLLGAALGLQDKFEAAVDETKKCINLYELELNRYSGDAQVTKWLQREAQAYVQLARLYGYWRRDRKELGDQLGRGITILQRLVKQDPDDDDPVRKVDLAWAHWNAGELAREFQDLDLAESEYGQALKLMKELGEKVYRNNEWRDRLARIHNGYAELWLGRAEGHERGVADLAGQETAIREALDSALDQVNLALRITADLARDRNNLAWQTVHGWSLNNSGAVKLSRSKMLLIADDLDSSVVDFHNALEIRERLKRLAPKHSGWSMDARWTKINLNEAEATQAKRDKNYGAMRDKFRDNVTQIEEALRNDPNNDDWHYQHAINLTSYADALILLRQDQLAQQTYSKVRTAAIERKGGHREEGERRRWEQLIKRIDH
jgi:hypothetical protein